MFDGFALNRKKTSKGNVLLLLQSMLAEISAAVRGLFVMEQLQDTMWTQTSTRPKVNLRKESCKDSEKTMLPHKVLVSFVLIILL